MVLDKDLRVRPERLASGDTGKCGPFEVPKKFNDESTVEKTFRNGLEGVVLGHETGDEGRVRRVVL